jgi:hypothetical protein
MKRSSWIILAICLFIALGLGATYLLTRGGSDQLTQEAAIDMTRRMERAFEEKNADGIVKYISTSPDTRISNLSHDQIRLLLVRYFRNSDRLSADLTNYTFAGGDTDATLQFDLVVHNNGIDSRKEDYSGHITLHLRRIEVSHLLGLYQTKEWRIASAETTGPDLSSFGD